MAETAESKRVRSLRTWGLVCLVVFVLAGVGWPTVRAARRAAHRMARRNDMKQVALGLHNFNDVYRRLPPAVRTDDAGRPLYSWRFQLLHFLEGIMLPVDSAARWDDPVNRFLWAYHCFCWNYKGNLPESGYTNVMAITGAGTAFETGKVTRLQDLDQDTILAMEVAESDTFWMEPGDLSVGEIDASVLRGLDGTGTHVVFADGSAWFVAAETPWAEVSKFLTIEGAKRYDREEVLGPFQKGRFR